MHSSQKNPSKTKPSTNFVHKFSNNARIKSLSVHGNILTLYVNPSFKPKYKGEFISGLGICEKGKEIGERLPIVFKDGYLFELLDQVDSGKISKKSVMEESAFHDRIHTDNRLPQEKKHFHFKQSEEIGYANLECLLTRMQENEDISKNEQQKVLQSYEEFCKASACPDELPDRQEAKISERHTHDRHELSIMSEGNISEDKSTLSSSDLFKLQPELQTSSASRTTQSWLSFPIKLLQQTSRPVYSLLDACSFYFDYLINASIKNAIQLTQDCPNYFPKSSPNFWKNGGAHTLFSSDTAPNNVSNNAYVIANTGFSGMLK